MMFITNNKYTKNDIYQILNVPIERRKGAWDTGYREYEGNIYIFSNVGVPGRTGHDYNNYWDGDLFFWEAGTHSHINQPHIKKLLNSSNAQNIFLFTRTMDKDAFTYEGTIKVKEYSETTPVKFVWELCDVEYSQNDLKSNIVLEGNVQTVLVNKQERNPLARRICIGHHGAYCHICDFDFEKKYGEIGKNYIHVHHIIPISSYDQEYELDPIKDLIPVCPNCHTMLHRKKEFLSIQELKDILKNA